jgi:uncharacterized protein involved in exopolysaccharide biosynthesis
MPDFLTVLSRWWKMIIGITAAVAIITALLVSLKEKEFLATVTALPANSIASDKAHIFGDNIQQLYPTIGLPEELDPVLGTAALDTLYIALAEAHNLGAHYKMNVNDGNVNVYAGAKLRQNMRVVRSEFGGLKINVWDKDPQLAAAIANDMFARLQSLHQYLQNQSNALTLRRLEESYAKLSGNSTDTSGIINTNESNNAEARRMAQLISEYRLQLATNPPALLLVEGARVPLFPDRPKPLPVFLLAVFLALIFSLLLAVFMESRRPRNL